MADFATSSHPAVQAQLDRLAILSPAGDRLGLERITALLERLDRPQDALPPVLHVAGTNGKGSTCAFLRAAIEASGLKAHVFTSPHLVRFNERIRIAGRLIEDEALAALLEEVIDASRGIEPSFFEATTAAAFLAFARTPADACILEVGLGGRLDATNVVERPLVTAIASLGIDHRQFLGSRMVEIAGEKAGIAKVGVPLVTQLYHPSIAARIDEIARDVGANCLPRGVSWDATVERQKLRYRDEAGDLVLPVPRLPGRHQALNAALAVAMLRHQQVLEIPESAYGAAMGWADWPGRLQQLADGPLLRLLPAGSELWVDGGHNPAAARAVASFARRKFAGRPLHLIFASLSSKDPQGTLTPFQGFATHAHTLPIPNHDSRKPEDLASLAHELGFEASSHSNLEDALKAIDEPAPVLIFGSLYLVGEALAANGQAPD
jgi:dihydrofolate synthase/folylpolyglutamate synthase